MRRNYFIPSYACLFRINFGQGQVSSSWLFHEMAIESLEGQNGFIEYKDMDTDEWFPFEEVK